MHRVRTPLFLLVHLLSTIVFAGCASTGVHRHDLDQHGMVFYFDGAGGGSVLTNWGRGVKQGLERAGYRGDFRNFPWHTGLGVAADQNADLAYKRTKARQAAEELKAYITEHPGRPVHIVGLSAGTAVATFLLEAMPEHQPVDGVVLLGSSISAHHDMTEALMRVRNGLRVFTSDKDAVLSVLVPISGTADRQFCGACSAGLQGFHLPPNSSPETRRQYGKITNVAWRPEFARAGNHGGHTDTVNASFVRDYIAPVLLDSGPHFMLAGPVPINEPAADASAGASSG